MRQQASEQVTSGLMFGIAASTEIKLVTFFWTHRNLTDTELSLICSKRGAETTESRAS